jgi:hypothetical protein
MLSQPSVVQNMSPSLAKVSMWKEGLSWLLCDLLRASLSPLPPGVHCSTERDPVKLESMTPGYELSVIPVSFQLSVLSF